MVDHDHSYKQLFSHPELIRDLLTGFVREEWVKQLDVSTLERVNGSFVSDDLRERESDIIWRVKLKESWVYIYLLVEFQSTVDRYMAVRMLTYICLLYQDLQKNGKLAKDGKLPPVLPLVLYNGRKKWRAATGISDLIYDISGGLAKYRPDFQYLLLNEQKYADDSLPAHNLVSAIFRLEQSQSPDDIRMVVRTLITWLKHPEQSTLRRAFTVWINRGLISVRLPGHELPELKELVEVDAMLAERVKEWTEEWKEKGLRQGIKEGLQQGIEQGLEQGLEQGIEQGKREGLLETIEVTLSLKFGVEGLKLLPSIHSIYDIGRLKMIKESARYSSEIAEVKKHLF